MPFLPFIAKYVIYISLEVRIFLYKPEPVCSYFKETNKTLQFISMKKNSPYN